MNAFPAELIQHQYACMLVSGLLPSQHRPQLQTAGTSSRITTTSTESEKATTNEISASSALSIPQNSEKEIGNNASPTAGPSTPPTSTSTSSSIAQSGPENASDKFPTLSKDLCDIFISRGRSTAWDPAKANSATFHTVLVDQNVRLPPRKTRPSIRTLTATPPEKQGLSANLPPRSPLSPLHPSSPLFPDGLIAPVWLRKHRELVPSVFVAFHCLAEHSMPIPPPTPPKGRNVESETVAEVNEKQEAEGTPRMTAGLSGPELKAKDEELIRIIAERKRSLSERGIKLTVVLLTTRVMLESSTLEQRLSFIRRSSQLDSKASLFVLTPVSKSELGEFVTSLQNALFDHAMDYYREQFRRVRRKRQKYPPSSAIVSQTMSVAAELRGSPIKDQPLRKEGWLARCDYKMGAFAEFGCNLDDALTHYTNAYQGLCNELLTSTMLLPPRTKRWAEAKVLADTLSFRISKLYLYRDNGEGAWDQFRMHLKKFIELSQGWGIGEMTFEFWSWLGKQYKLMGDLLDLAMREIPGSTLPPFRPSMHFPPMPMILLHPLHLPMPTASGNVAPSYNPHHGNLAAPNEAAINSFSVPAEMCPGAGECFYIAGICALERWERYKRLQWEQDQRANGSVGEVKPNESWSTVNITQESKVDHSGQAIEALTRAHEVFKRQKRHRLSLFVASKIANAYIEANQDELALRFLERTVKSYQFENWSGPLTSQLLLALESARRIGDVESEGKALWKLLSKGSALEKTQYDLALEQIREWIANRELPQAKQPAKIDFARTNGPLCVNVMYGTSIVSLDSQPVHFQVQISSQNGRGLEGVTFDRLSIHVSDEKDENIRMIIHHQESDSSSILTTIKPLDLSRFQETDDHKAGLSELIWSEGQIRVFQGSLIARNIGFLQITKVVLEKDGKAPFHLDFNTSNTDEEEYDDVVQPVWFVGLKGLTMLHLPFVRHQDGVEVQRKKHNLNVEIQHEAEAYLDEIFTFKIKVSNKDSIPLTCSLDAHVLGPPGEMLSSDEVWSHADIESTRLSSVRDVFLGKLEPDESIEHFVFVKCKNHLTKRTIDFVLHSKGEEMEEGSEAITSETVISRSLPVLPIFSHAYYAQWRLYRDADQQDSKSSSKEITAASVGSEDVTHVTAIAALNVGLSVLANRPIRLHRISIALDKESKHLRIWGPNGSQISEKESVEVSGIWSADDKWGGVYDIEILSENVVGMPIEAEDASLRPTGKLMVEWQRDSDNRVDEEENSNMISVSAIPLPLLLPPHLLSRLIVSLPSSTSIEQPLVLLITIVNPSRLAAEIFINIDDSSSDFIIQSHRSFTVPNLMPKSTRSVPIHVAPSRFLQQKGVAAAARTLPRIRAWQRDRRHSTPLASTSSNVSNVNPGIISARTSIDSSSIYGVGNGQLNSNTQDDLPQIVNQRPGAGVPLEVLLRYTSKTAGGVGTTAAGAAIALPSAAVGANQLGGGLMNNKTGAKETNEMSQNQAVNTTIDVAAHLQAETQRTGLWTIFVH